jgi:hypothetical protein
MALAATNVTGYEDVIWQHSKTGGRYVIIYFGLLENTMEPAVIYQELDAEGPAPVWVRPATQFFDGRFLPSGRVDYGKD